MAGHSVCQTHCHKPHGDLDRTMGVNNEEEQYGDTENIDGD